ncbi:MAG: type II secretion system protein GspG [Alphaproteobacteria bacterium]|nr:type II secretion system protein GspG [Alphaproteobacteria bacterium]
MAKPAHAELRARRRNESGYTLLEVLIVLTIIAMAAALIGPRLLTQLDRSKVTAARVQLRAFGSALDAFRMDVGRYPTDTEGLSALVAAPASDRDAGAYWQGPYLDGDIPDDPWGRPYTYAPPQTLEARPVILSYGADGRAGGRGLSEDIRYGDAAP